MKTIIGQYFACGTDGDEIIFDGIDILQKDASNQVKTKREWISIETKIEVVGIYPEGIPCSKDFAGMTFPLDVYKICVDNKEIYFGWVEVRMCWYLFYKFTDEDIVKIKK